MHFVDYHLAAIEAIQHDGDISAANQISSIRWIRLKEQNFPFSKMFQPARTRKQ